MSERADLVNHEGIVMKRSIGRDDVERHEGLYLQIVIAVITNSAGHVLVHQRAHTKRVNPGDIDHVCGGILAGESPEDAAKREALEEAGVNLKNIQIVRRGINAYQRYCHLVRAESDDEPPENHNPREANWAAYYHPDELVVKRDAREFTFVDDFFEDLSHVLNGA